MATFLLINRLRDFSMDLLTVCLFISTGITTGGVMVVQAKVEKE